jgi:hypothetical protein
MLLLVIVYLIAAAVASIGFSAIAVFALGAYDPRIFQSPTAAFDLALLNCFITTAISTVTVAIAAVTLRKRLTIDRRALLITVTWASVFSAVLYLLVLRGIDAAAPESLLLAISVWLYLLGVPLLMFVVLSKLQASRTTAQGAL